MAEARVDEARHGRVLELVMRDPAQRNALTPEISTGLTRALRGVAKPVVKIGVNPDGGGSWFLARALPPQLAAHLQHERESFAELLHRPEGAEGLAAFLEQREPRLSREEPAARSRKPLRNT